MKRRKFIKSLAGTTAYLGLAGLPLEAFSKKDLIQLTILHSNDIHSHIDPFPDNDPRNAGQGGAARKAAAIKKIRAEQENVLLFDAGDMLQGSPYYNMYKGELEFKIMSEMGYDGATVGNHEFDNGLEQLVEQLPHAKFPFISSNYDFTNTPMEGKTIRYKIFDKGGLSIGVFGLGIELEGLVNKRMYGNTVYNDAEATAAEMSFMLKKEKKCDLVVCISHLGYKYKSKKVSDHIIAKKSKYIDIILGGHTHSFFDNALKYKNSDNKEILICQAGCYGLRMGRVDYFFEKKSKKKVG
ncbi:MAG TPA: bifunctional metallophosphatase/5'-nucleotidase [Flavobacteriales bacterium]|nr:bifunctional metallophosphatase/5'-nucleotidase [Flavobacteriales bacterium]